MEKIGRFKGILVYKVSNAEWEQNLNSKWEERLYIVDNKVYYHDMKIARLDAWGDLADFDEALFSAIVAKVERGEYERKKEEPKVEERAEVAPQSAAKPVNESVDAGTAFDIDSYLKGGDIDLDAYIAEMKGKVLINEAV